MKCLYCDCTESKVIDSRSADDDKTIRRRRECVGCGRRFTTYETIEVTPVLVVKNNGTRQSYNAEKIRNGIIKGFFIVIVGITGAKLVISSDMLKFGL